MSDVYVISAFPGVGKTTFYDNYKDHGGLVVVDSDSSKWPKDGFPNNYVDHLEKLIESYRSDTKDDKVIILVSTHEAVRYELAKKAINFVVVHPDISLKEEYIQRYKDRGSPEAFVNLLSSKWEEFINGIENSGDTTIAITNGVYLTSVLESIL